MSRSRAVPMATFRRLRSEGLTHKQIAETTGFAERTVSYRLSGGPSRRKSATKEKLLSLPPFRYGLELYETRTGKKVTVIGESKPYGTWRVLDEGANFCDSHDISVLELSALPPVTGDDQFISERLAGFTRSSEPVSLLDADESRRQKLIEHAMKLAAEIQPTTATSRRSAARSGADPDTNLKATQERKHALRREAEAERTGKPFTLLIQRDQRPNEARKAGRNVLHGKHPRRLPGEFVCPFCKSLNTWSKGANKSGKKRRICKAEGCGKPFTLGEKAAQQKGGAQ